MSLKQIYQPISKELSQVEMELKNVVSRLIGADNSKQVIKHFFNIPGKRLRPALVLLSAKAVSTSDFRLPTSDLLSLATAVELIHSASLIHDDIVDSADKRREQVSLNKQFGNKIAVLTGDLLYTSAFLRLTDKLDKKIIRILSQCVQKMCAGEINELQNTSSDTCHSESRKKRDKLQRRISYLKIIEDKTASFMSACCQCGAELHGTNKKSVDGLTNYGLNLGMTYQIIDDYIDKDSVVVADLGLRQAEEFASKAKRSIKVLKNSIYKEKLSDLVDYIIVENKNG